MRDDELKQLLNRAEADLPALLPATSDTVRGVRKRFAARQRRRRAATVVSCLTLVFALGWRFAPTHDPRPVPTEQVAQLDVQRELAEIRRLQDLADSESRILQRTLRLDRQARARSELAVELAAAEREPSLADQRDEVAYRMILRADALTDMMQPSEQAVELYRQVMSLYPTTDSAELARERLKRLGMNGRSI